MTKSYSGGTNFDWPEKGDTNWSTTVDTSLGTLSSHDHTGGGAGTQIATAAIATNAVTDTKIRLGNATFLRARNAAGTADVNLLRATTSDFAQIFPMLVYGGVGSDSETLTSSGAVSVSLPRTALNGASLAMTLAAPTASGQLKLIVNVASTAATITPTPTAGANTVTLGTQSAVLYWSANGEWIVIGLSPGAHVTDDTQAFAAADTWNGWSKNVTCSGTTYTITTPAGYSGQTVTVYNGASGNVTFGGVVMATGTYYLYSYLNAGWRRVALT